MTRPLAHQPRKMGRPSRLNAAVQDRLVTALRSGATRESCATYAGIGITTFHTWMQKGEERPGSDYADFRAAVKAAEADSEILLAGRLMAAAAGDWRAALSVLERRFPDAWGRRDALVHEGNDKRPVRFVLNIASAPGTAAAKKNGHG